MSLALATLLYEWRRYTAAVVALAFSGVFVAFVPEGVALFRTEGFELVGCWGRGGVRGWWVPLEYKHWTPSGVDCGVL